MDGIPNSVKALIYLSVCRLSVRYWYNLGWCTLYAITSYTSQKGTQGLFEGRPIIYDVILFRKGVEDPYYTSPAMAFCVPQVFVTPKWIQVRVALNSCLVLCTLDRSIWISPPVCKSRGLYATHYKAINCILVNSPRDEKPSVTGSCTFFKTTLSVRLHSLHPENSTAPYHLCLKNPHFCRPLVWWEF